MPAQALTPRTTRNSRGLRRSPVSSVNSGRVSRRSRTSGNLSSPRPAQAAALEAVAEEQLATPTRVAVARPPVFPPPVSLPPATPQIFTPPPRTSSPPEHPRISAIRSASARSARRFASPRTPVRYPRTPRYLTRFVDVTPTNPPAPGPDSPAYETRLFRQRRDEEGEERFARELWIAIRNDQYMKGCWCGPPNIYNSREEAEVAIGHLRFYVVGSETKNLRVLQRKDDFRWHCSCGNNEYRAVYKNLINANGKRPAEDTEIDLIAQDQGSKSGQPVDRVVPAPNEPPTAEEDHSQASGNTQQEVPTPAPSMWAQAFNILNRAVVTMGSPLVTLYGKLREQLRVDSYETVDTFRKDAHSGSIIVKRLKHQAPGSSIEQNSPSANCDDGFDELVWADDPMRRIGFERLQGLASTFAGQIENIKAGKVVGGASISDIRKQIQDGQDLGASIAIHMYQEYRHGPTSPDEADDERADKLLNTLVAYQDRLTMTIGFMRNVYDCDLFEELKRRHPEPPRRLRLGNTMFRQNAMMAGEFLCFLRSLDNVCRMDSTALETICQIIVDANAIHKQEMVPSFVELKHNPIEDMPGYFPEEKPSILEEVPADELIIEPLYDFKFPEPEPSNWEDQIEPGDYRLVPKPKGILKPSKEWDVPASPRYVTTPEKKRKLAFKSPISKFIPPAHIPAKVMTPSEADQIVKAKLKAEVLRDEHSIRMFEASRTVSRQRDITLNFRDRWTLDDLEKDDKEMGLTYHARKYDGFLSDLHDDLEKRAGEDKENRLKPTIKLAPRRRMVQIPLPPLPSTPELRQRAAHLLENDTSSPGASSPAVNPLMRPKAEEKPSKPAEKKPPPRTLEEFFAEDDDDLEISTAKLQQLQIDRQIREEFETGVQRSIEEKRKRQEEEALREKQRREEEERRRQEEERRREQEARRQREDEEFARLTGLRQPTRPLITSLSREWDLRVTNAARANPTAELVKTLEGQPLTRRDFEEKLLPPTAWLNDNVIIGSILHIANYINTVNGATDQEPKCAAFTSYFWPRLLSHGPGGCGRLLRRAGVRKANLLNIDTILIPICAQSHWTLAVIRPSQRTVSHIDSMRAGRGDESVKNKLLELVRFILEDQFVEADWRAVDYEAPRQTNGWDCGVFTITNAMCMALSLNPKYSYTERELTLQRRRLAAVLLNEGFKGEFSLDGF
ncbi:hypothetical protein C8A03DRAFT_32675 [Achaetomium macrosporum]|uniref:Ubiquitin-like protease family profile domain-containing protein n=1 Tax=Achaetomium macrosporum TaxID=79813 RepID=A0AAN7CC27_9PEZI|nr:hypothetical protein C8A03DRAFT_32675 [Achaetomium macrosporum]